MFFAKSKKAKVAAEVLHKSAADGGEESKEKPEKASAKAPAKEPMSVTEYLEKKFPKKENTFKTVEDKEIELEMKKIDQEVDQLVQKKVKEFSFQVKDNLEHFPEVDQLNMIIDKSIIDYKLAKKFN